MKTSKKIRNKKIPAFKSEDQERRYWATHDSADHIDWSSARPLVLPDLKPTTTTISLRLPDTMLSQLKLLANKKDVPYQSLLKTFLSEKISEELKFR